jgi:hypothetical protein
LSAGKEFQQATTAAWSKHKTPIQQGRTNLNKEEEDTENNNRRKEAEKDAKALRKS